MNKNLLNAKQTITALFNANVKGVEIHYLETPNEKHCGKEGHWLETKMGIKHNCKNEPDILGFEMKKSSLKHTTLGDYTATEYIFSKNRPTINEINQWTDEIKINRTQFIHYFGNPNANKNNRYSWSGKCVPSYGEWNENGQTLTVLENNDIAIYYSFAKDLRTNKTKIIPAVLQKDNVLTVIWKAGAMKRKIENKFNQQGFFICNKVDNKYETICFGKPFHFEYFIECIKNKKIIFDSGMYEGNPRPYSQFRGREFWNDLLIKDDDNNENNTTENNQNQE